MNETVGPDVGTQEFTVDEADRFRERARLNVVQHVPLPTPRMFTQRVIKEVADEHGVTPEDILWRSRRVKFVRARHAAMRRVSEARPQWSYPALGRLFGRDHTSIMHAFERTGGLKPTRGTFVDLDTPEHHQPAAASS